MISSRYVVVGGNAVAERGQALLQPLNHHAVRQGVPHVLQLLVCGIVRHKEAVLIAHAHSPNKANRVEVLRAAVRAQAVRVGEHRKDPDVRVALELHPGRHGAGVTEPLFAGRFAAQPPEGVEPSLLVPVTVNVRVGKAGRDRPLLVRLLLTLASGTAHALAAALRGPAPALRQRRRHAYVRGIASAIAPDQAQQLRPASMRPGRFRLCRSSSSSAAGRAPTSHR
eukprot:scaffold4463_cov367-Prasinococcus_capsulatus_cf.AAC.8